MICVLRSMFSKEYDLGSEGDVFEPNQVVKARERLGDLGLDIRMVPGGHLTTSEEPELLARIIEEVGPASDQGRAHVEPPPE